MRKIGRLELPLAKRAPAKRLHTQERKIVRVHHAGIQRYRFVAHAQDGATIVVTGNAGKGQRACAVVQQVRIRGRALQVVTLAGLSDGTSGESSVSVPPKAFF